MPSYQMFVNKGQLTAEQKAKAAVAITDAHCAKTGAPRWYVQVIINEVEEGNRFICGFPAKDIVWLRGDVRIRTHEQNKELMDAIAAGVGEACGMPSGNVWIDLSGIDSLNVLKVDTTFPTAGGEKEWFETLSESTLEQIRKLESGS